MAGAPPMKIPELTANLFPVECVQMNVRRRLALFLFVLFVFPLAVRAQAPEGGVRITARPSGIAHGVVPVPVTVGADTVRVELTINGVKSGEQKGLRSMVFHVRVGKFLRRLRLHVTGYDAQNRITGEDEIVLNDPRPPFRAKLVAREIDPAATRAEFSAIVTAPESVRVQGVDFFLGETALGTDAVAPYSIEFNPSMAASPSYARVVARAADGSEANDVVFFGDTARASIDVVLQRIPISIVGPAKGPIAPQTLRLVDNGTEQKIEAVAAAHDQPLNVVMLIDSSESMLEELPLLKQAAKQFARSVLRRGDRLAIVGFNQHTFWLTPFTADLALIDRAVDRLRPMGQTHLYDSVIEMLFELQKQEGRRALVVLTDGANQGGDFELDHLVHYAKYSGVPIYPVIKNTMLRKLMRVGVGYMQMRKLVNLAKDTGARYFIIEKNSQLPAVYAAIADELRRQYTLMFYPPDVVTDQWHSIVVESTNGTQLRAPRGYFP